MIERMSHSYLLVRTDYVEYCIDLRRPFLVSLQNGIDCHGAKSLQQETNELLWKLL
jgi:hypothetical protein